MLTFVVGDEDHHYQQHCHQDAPFISLFWVCCNGVMMDNCVVLGDGSDGVGHNGDGCAWCHWSQQSRHHRQCNHAISTTHKWHYFGVADVLCSWGMLECRFWETPNVRWYRCKVCCFITQTQTAHSLLFELRRLSSIVWRRKALDSHHRCTMYHIFIKTCNLTPFLLCPCNTLVQHCGFQPYKTGISCDAIRVCASSPGKRSGLLKEAIVLSYGRNWSQMRKLCQNKGFLGVLCPSKLICRARTATHHAAMPRPLLMKSMDPHSRPFLRVDRIMESVRYHIALVAIAAEVAKVKYHSKVFAFVVATRTEVSIWSNLLPRVPDNSERCLKER